MENNSCLENNYDGITYDDSSGGLAIGNDCSHNLQAGIAVYYEAAPTLEQNSCTGNDVGLDYYWGAEGIARENDLSGNIECISISDFASPVLIDNICTDGD